MIAAAVLLASAAWTPPPGIPAPPFGVTESAGPPTYYVNNAVPCSDDDGVRAGTPARPLCTIPTSLAAGSVVEVRGGPYVYGEAGLTVNMAGTAAAPVFLRGVGKPQLKAKYGACEATALFRGQYYIVEGLDLAGCLSVYMGGRHGVLRDSAVRGFKPGGNDAAVSLGKPDMVVLRVTLEDNGPNPLPASVEQDVHGAKVWGTPQRIWILDSTCGYNAGDCIQIGDDSTGNPSFVYVGRNKMVAGGGENGVDIKRATDVVVSGNEAAGFRSSSHSDGAALDTQEGANRVWFLFNRVRDSEQGIRVAGAGEAHVLGNLITGIRNTRGKFDPEGCYDSAGYGFGILGWSGSGPATVADNTVAASDRGIAWHRQGVLSGNVVTQPSRKDTFAACSDGNQASQARSVLEGDVRGLGCSGCRKGPARLRPDYVPEATSPAVGLQTPEAAYARFRALYGLDIQGDLAGQRRPAGKWTAGALEPAPAAQTPGPR